MVGNYLFRDPSIPPSFEAMNSRENNASTAADRLVELDVQSPVWDRFFFPAPLFLIGTLESDGEAALAPKHMVTPLGWQNYFGFVCTPRHSTCTNIDRDGVFTVSFPRPSQIVHSSLAASPREAGGDKPILDALETVPARHVEGVVIAGAYIYLECRHVQTVDGFGENCLITGEIVSAYADEECIRGDDRDDQELLSTAPVLAYVTPGRFAAIDVANAFPFPAAMKK